MVKNKKGFIAMSLIYTFFLLFIAILIYILGYYAHNIGLLNVLKADIKKNLESVMERPWDENCFSSSLKLNCRLLLRDVNVINPAFVIANKTDLSNPIVFSNPADAFINPEITNDMGLHNTSELYLDPVSLEYISFGNSYFYRGAVKNNYVIFGKSTGTPSRPLFWQIVRINGDGSIRLILLGSNPSDRNIYDNKNSVLNVLSSATQAKIIVNSRFCTTYKYDSTNISQNNILTCDSFNTAMLGDIGVNEAIAAGADSDSTDDNNGFFLYRDQYDGIITSNPNKKILYGKIIDAVLPFTQTSAVISISADSLVMSSSVAGTIDDPYVINMN